MLLRRGFVKCVTCALAGVSTCGISCPYHWDTQICQGHSWLNGNTLPGLDSLRFLRAAVAAKLCVLPFFPIPPLLTGNRSCGRKIQMALKIKRLTGAVLWFAGFSLRFCAMAGVCKPIGKNFPGPVCSLLCVAKPLAARPFSINTTA